VTGPLAQQEPVRKVYRTIYWEDDPSRTRSVVGLCRVCDKHWPIDVLEPQVVSANGIAHHSEESGMTLCGRDATSDAWWWAL
jgi:hypothetical protein